MSRALAHIDYRGGRGARHVDGGVTATGRARSAPRKPPYVGAAILAGCKDIAAQHTGARFYGTALRDAIPSDAKWEALLGAVDAHLTHATRPIARDVLQHHRENMLQLQGEALQQALDR